MDKIMFYKRLNAKYQEDGGIYEDNTKKFP
jgi:hypothetical protein